MGSRPEVSDRIEDVPFVLKFHVGLFVSQAPVHSEPVAVDLAVLGTSSAAQTRSEGFSVAPHIGGKAGSSSSPLG